MNPRPVLYFLAIICLINAGCKKNGNTITTPGKTGMDSNGVKLKELAQTQSQLQTATALSQTQASKYPYTDTYVGQYNENNPDVTPQNYSGISTVYVVHVSADTLVISAQSIGIPHGTTNYPGTVNTVVAVKAGNTYKLYSQWFEDRTDMYTCTIANDTLHCDIVQSSACYGNMGEYDGTYNGYKQK